MFLILQSTEIFIKLKGSWFNMIVDKLIIGAGIYGLYSALKCGESGQSVIVLERESAPFMRATYINQARVHMGYHYPRSISTAKKVLIILIVFAMTMGSVFILNLIKYMLQVLILVGLMLKNSKNSVMMLIFAVPVLIRNGISILVCATVHF